MKIRADSLVLLGVLACFAGVMLWLLQRTTGSSEPYFETLTTYSPLPDGAKALFQLLETQGYKPQRNHENEYHYPDKACVVILDTSGAALFGHNLDPKALRLWMEEGGYLLLCAEPQCPAAVALLTELEADKKDPKLAKRLEQFTVEARHLGAGTGGKLVPVIRVEGKGDVYKLPAKSAELFKGVRKIEVSSLPPQDLSAVSLLDADGSVVLYRRVGEGALLMLTRPELASNSWISRQDNHRLLLNLVGAASKGRQIYFDEHIHGFARENPNIMALLAHTYGGHLLLLLILLALVLFAGAAVRPARFSVETVPVRRQGTEMVLAQADLYQSAGARNVIADSQIDSLRRAFMERRSLATPPSDAKLLEWIELEWAGDSTHKTAIAEYLRSRWLPRTPGALLDLAKACDTARAMLS
jgi:hypothetical protein